MKQLILSVFLGLATVGFAQDSVQIDERSFLQVVWSNSPMIKSQELNNAVAATGVLQAKASFQPRFESNFEQKRFDSSLYYNRLNSGIGVQTPFGAKFSTGYQSTNGVYLNPESNLPQNGLRYATLEVPIGAGLVTDKYRTALKLARYNVSYTELRVKIEQNKFLFEAGKAYWKWYESMSMLALAEEAQAVTRKRLDFVRSKQSIGEYAAIDTLEAFINLQNRMSFYNEQLILLQKRQQDLATYLGSNQADLTPLVDLEMVDQRPDSAWSKDLVESHPIMRMFELKEMGNDAHSRLAKEFFKPELNLKYGVLSAMDIPLSGTTLSQDNYVGLRASFPLLLRSERARAEQYKLRNEIIGFEKEFFRLELDNNMQANMDMRLSLYENQRLWRSASSNYSELLEAEQKRFRMGESNNFIINRREIQWLKARKSYVKSYVDFRIKLLEYYYLLALLPDLADG